MATTTDPDRDLRSDSDDARPASGIDSESSVPNDDEEPVCANCGGVIGPDDLVCPHCGISLVSG